MGCFHLDYHNKNVLCHIDHPPQHNCHYPNLLMKLCVALLLRCIIRMNKSIGDDKNGANIDPRLLTYRKDKI